MSQENTESILSSAAARLSPYDDQRKPYAMAVRRGLIALAGIIVLSLIVWGIAAGMPGVWAVLIGGAIGGGFTLFTMLSGWVSAYVAPQLSVGIILGSWLLKMVLLFVVMVLIRDLTFYHRGAFVTTTFIALAVTLGVEVMSILRSKTTYTQ
ncbi:hypothetical protein EML15_07615 [Corynebacterium sp. sy017]|uniref:hypothetical protein n=1 Tax=unclassified Corynebacterium TaxID=2624378 RepID=UPI001185D827|nr:MULTISPECIES: hypothetical protein [unclassified Corynebacterium]MBP3089010.1 hypothetical protein [Corynebacterium sp. sy017]QDZ42377.1 hypothetical protein FQV43_03775 [Corynebacterium sp. sy039]TSD91332.1 hypothetical protein ELY17_07625 [Corynebacterium sp. SY003]